MPDPVADEPLLLDDAEDDALLSFSSPFSASFRSHLSCGLLETRFALTCTSFLVVLLFWAHQGVLAMAMLAFVAACVMMALLRLVLMARYKPTELYELDDAEQRAIREQQQIIKSPHTHSTLNTHTPHTTAYQPANPTDRSLLRLTNPLPSFSLSSFLCGSASRLDVNVAGALNPTHLRLAMMDRDFTPNDYELLLALDEEMRTQQHRGIPQPLIERLPTFTIPASTRKASEASETGGQESEEKARERERETTCAICLEPKLPGEMVRMLPVSQHNTTRHNTVHRAVECALL